jgi:hypothetical protein
MQLKTIISGIDLTDKGIKAADAKSSCLKKSNSYEESTNKK